LGVKILINFDIYYFLIYKSMTGPKAPLKGRVKEQQMELVKVKRNYQITIPQNLRRIIRLTVGEYVEVDIKDDTLVIRPVKVIHPDQEYFFTKEWQEKEAEADKDIAEGEVVGPFEAAQDALKALKNQPL
jgi:AbrB family looped-hinge helix DNA binding protein